MDEELYTRDSPKKSTRRRVEPENTTKEKSMGDKLKNETSAADSYRRKLRHGKADNRMTAEEAKKLKKQRKQGRKKAYAEVAATQKVRNQISKSNEDDNAGVDAIAYGMEATEVVTTKVRDAHYSRKMHKRREADKQKNPSKYGDPKGAKAEGSNETSRQLQKSRMKKEIQRHAQQKQAKETANGANKISKKFTDKAEDMIGRLAEWVTEFLEEHPGLLIAILLLLIIVVMLAGMLSSCGAAAGGVQNVTIATSFTADDDVIRAVEADYVELEADLQDTIDNIERDHPGYDEYNYTLAEISHNPFELAALLTVLYEDYTESEVQAMLQTIFNHQYTLDIESVTEIRTRTETRTGYTWVSTGVVNGVETGYWDPYEYEVEVEYEYYILNTTLTNNGVAAAIPHLNLTADQLQRYALLLETLGNKPDVFGDNPYARPGVSEEYQDYAIPGEYMTDQQFARMIHEAEKYLGYPYVWGGSSPSTSFDCSGFVSYVINHCGNGWNYGRLTANGWKNATARVHSNDVQPGDLVFFQGTYNTSGASHVGIVVDPVNKIMIHCGNPIQYASYDTTYWRAHAYCYGRLP